MIARASILFATNSGTRWRNIAGVGHRRRLWSGAEGAGGRSVILCAINSGIEARSPSVGCKPLEEIDMTKKLLAIDWPPL
jgi:hypothetical protein